MTEASPLARYAVIGNPIAHSRSPQIHAMFSRQTGKPLRYDRLLAPVDGFAEAVAAFVAEGGVGLNVTVPFKLDAYALAAGRLSARARLAGAVIDALIVLLADLPIRHGLPHEPFEIARSDLPDVLGVVVDLIELARPDLARVLKYAGSLVHPVVGATAAHDVVDDVL